MTTGDVVSGLRVSVAGAAGTTDLVVPWTATAADVAAAYAATHELPTVPGLAMVSGRALDPSEQLERAGVPTGALLVAMSEANAERRTPVAAAPTGSGDGRPGQVLMLLAPATCLATAAAAATADGGWARYVAAAALVVGAVLPFLIRPARGQLPVAPAFAAGAAFVLSWSPSQGGVLVGLAAAAVMAAVWAAVGRGFALWERQHERVWHATALVVGGMAAAVLLINGSGLTFAAALYAVALVVARIVPLLAVDVPDQVLLDLDRLAVTAWSAREQPRRKRVRVMVPPSAVAGVLHGGQRTVTGAVVAVSVATLACAPALLTADGGLRRWGGMALLVFGGASLVFMARGHRAVVPRRALRVAGCTSLVAATVALVMELPAEPQLPLAVCLFAVGVLVAATAAAVGRGWRSLWWSRAGEVLEGLSLAFAIAAVPVATGLVDHLRSIGT